MADLGATWNEVVEAAGAAQEAARAYEQVREDPAHSEDERPGQERVQARD